MPELPLSECPLTMAEASKVCAAISDLRRKVGAPGDYGYASRLGLVLQKLYDIEQALDLGVVKPFSDDISEVRVVRMNIDWLRKQAKRLKNDAQTGEASALLRIEATAKARVDPEFVTHADCLLVIAIEQGYRSWEHLVAANEEADHGS